jgi:hypothetical protein
MSVQNMMIETIDSDWKWTYQAGGVSGILLGIAYFIIIALYIPVGAPPTGAEARVAYHAGNLALWRAILDLSVLTDFLFLPLAFALYLALKHINKNLMLMGAAFVLMFILLDLMLTWTNYASLIFLSGQYISAVDEAQRAAVVTAATYPTLVLESPLTFVYNTLTLSVGILMIGLAMLKGIFNKTTAYLGIATGILGIIAVFGPFLVPALRVTIIFASLLTTLWVMFAGYRLYRLGRQ